MEVTDARLWRPAPLRHKLLGVSGIDWVTQTMYFVFVLGVDAALRCFARVSTDFLTAGRAVPACEERFAR